MNCKTSFSIYKKACSAPECGYIKQSLWNERLLCEKQLNRDNTLVNIEIPFRNISPLKGTCIHSHEFQLVLFCT